MGIPRRKPVPPESHWPPQSRQRVGTGGLVGLLSFSMTGAELTSTLRSRIQAHPEWYHTIELAPDLETPGWFDLRQVAGRVLPASLKGKRCLDVATFDGFWAFEMEQREAREVVAIDLLDPELWDWPAETTPEVMRTVGARKGAGEGFLLAREALGSKVERVALSVYDLDPGCLGMFDVVYVGSVLLHLRDPVRALERVRSVCKGTLLVVDAIDPLLSLSFPRSAVATLDGIGRPWWWRPNLACLARMVRSAGFKVLRRPRAMFLPPGKAQGRPGLSLGALSVREGRQVLMRTYLGDPHGFVMAVPAPLGPAQQRR